MGFDELVREYRATWAERAAARASIVDERALDARQRALVARAATQLSDVDAVIRALRDDDAIVRAFVLWALEHRNEYPRVFVVPAVEAAARSRAERAIAHAARVHGAARVLDALARTLDARLLSQQSAAVLTYWVRDRADEDPAHVAAAARSFKWALWQSRDAAPGARSGSEPVPELIVQLLRCDESREHRAAFARAADAHLGCGHRLAWAWLERTDAHPGAVAAELSSGVATSLVTALASSTITLRVIPTSPGLARARDVVREIRDAIASGIEITRVRRELDPFQR
ncbi:hypothetical protein [Sandaracinus amylolyticus]|uniref:hypothetical protein n=1 Tax=Sandaracinus amylolyticus TaxID=927083 RepID=UPI001F31E3B0|nr:hypothetical protein [Sandaracinus amylolyticus]UJR78668.1 Hypothetical protein I5071_6990 [Sandaracinus amylolyticus]